MRRGGKRNRQIEADQTAAWQADDGRQPLHVKLPARFAVAEAGRRRVAPARVSGLS